jgi:hypothetical protein
MTDYIENDNIWKIQCDNLTIYITVKLKIVDKFGNVLNDYEYKAVCNDKI